MFVLVSFEVIIIISQLCSINQQVSVPVHWTHTVYECSLRLKAQRPIHDSLATSGHQEQNVHSPTSRRLLSHYRSHIYLETAQALLGKNETVWQMIAGDFLLLKLVTKRHMVLVPACHCFGQQQDAVVAGFACKIPTCLQTVTNCCSSDHETVKSVKQITNFPLIPLVIGRLPRLPLICMEDSNLSANSHKHYHVHHAARGVKATCQKLKLAGQSFWCCTLVATSFTQKPPATTPQCRFFGKYTFSAPTL